MSAIASEEKRWFEHPMANLVVGFLLTGVLGTALTQNFMDRREQEKRHAQAAMERKEAVRTVSELLATTVLQAELFFEAMALGDPAGDIDRRKDEYEQAFKAWRTRRGSLTLLSRELMSEENFRQFDEFVHRRLNDGTILPLRRCLVETYHASRTGGAADRPPACDFDVLLDASATCGDAVVEALYAFAATGASEQGPADREITEKVRGHIDEDCPGPG